MHFIAAKCHVISRFCILEKHTYHKTADVRTLAESLDIRLWFVPSGCTDLLQPLEKKCFGVLESTASLEGTGFTGVQLTKKDTVASMVCAWEHLGKEVIKGAWEI